MKALVSTPEIQEAQRRGTSAATQAAERAKRHIGPAQQAALEADVTQAYIEAQAAHNAARTAKHSYIWAIQRVYDAAIQLGARPARAHELAIGATEEAREAAQEAREAAQIVRHCLSCAQRAAAAWSAQYN